MISDRQLNNYVQSELPIRTFGEVQFFENSIANSLAYQAIQFVAVKFIETGSRIPIFSLLWHGMNIRHFERPRNHEHLALSVSSFVLCLFHEKYSRMLNVTQNIIFHAQHLYRGGLNPLQSRIAYLQLINDLCAMAFFLRGGLNLGLLAVTVQTINYAHTSYVCYTEETLWLALNNALAAYQQFHSVEILFDLYAQEKRFL